MNSTPASGIERGLANAADRRKVGRAAEREDVVVERSFVVQQGMWAAVVNPHVSRVVRSPRGFFNKQCGLCEVPRGHFITSCWRIPSIFDW